MERIVLVGPGRVGLALGHALRQADAVRELVYHGRRPEPPGHPLFVQGGATYHFGLAPIPPGTDAVFLTVPDDALPELAHTLAAQGGAPPSCAALHCSGALSTEPLAPLHVRGFAVGSMHPLQAVAHALSGADRLVGVAWAVSGEPVAVAAARRVAAALEGRILQVPVTRRPVYHAAAALASNGLAALLASAARVLVDAGVDPDEAVPALLPLVRGTVDNLEEMGVLPGLTGPVARGDVETVRLHLAALAPRDAALYRALALELVELSAERHGPEYPADALRTLLEEDA